MSRDRVRREIKVPSRYAQADLIAFSLNVADALELNEPTTYKEAKNSPNWHKWEKAMEGEMTSLSKNHTWKLVGRPSRQRIIGYKVEFFLLKKARYSKGRKA